MPPIKILAIDAASRNTFGWCIFTPQTVHLGESKTYHDLDRVYGSVDATIAEHSPNRIVVGRAVHFFTAHKRGVILLGIYAVEPRCRS